jgi:hypothetical protein
MGEVTGAALLLLPSGSLFVAGMGLTSTPLSLTYSGRPRLDLDCDCELPSHQIVDVVMTIVVVMFTAGGKEL